jgi:hypothetical protein
VTWLQAEAGVLFFVIVSGCVMATCSFIELFSLKK